MAFERGVRNHSHPQLLEAGEMPHITRDSLMTLEAYDQARPEFRTQVMAHKKNRTLHLGEHVTLIFEDELTVRYQIQEMLRVERVFEVAGIQDELDAYNPLVPDGSNWKVTMMIEYADPSERSRMLARLIGIEDRVWVQVEGCARVYAVADEDLERENAEKTSSVHFLRFELESAMAQGLKRGVSLAVGIDHPEYSASIGSVPPAVHASLVNDLKP
jgi:hypothetical protein